MIILSKLGSEKTALNFTLLLLPLNAWAHVLRGKELAALLINAHRNIDFLEGLIKHTPNKDTFAELILLKECTYSRMIGYDSSGFREVFTSREIGKGNISPIINVEAAYRAAINTEINAPDLSRTCGIAFYGAWQIY